VLMAPNMRFPSLTPSGRLSGLGAGQPPIADSARLIEAERRITFLSRLMDDLVPLPGTGRRVGLDAVVGIIPGVGDLATAAVGAWIIAEARRFGLPGPVIGRMVVNLALDLVVGVVPILGDLFDVAFRANRRNLDLFRHHATSPSASVSGHRAFLAGILLTVVGLGWLLLSALGTLLTTNIG
jgi:hypothetical protein